MEVKIEVEKESSEEEYKDWEIKDAADTVCRAEEIKKNPKLWPLVKEKILAKAEAVNAAVKSLDDLKKVAREKSKESGAY